MISWAGEWAAEILAADFVGIDVDCLACVTGAGVGVSLPAGEIGRAAEGEKGGGAGVDEVGESGGEE